MMMLWELPKHRLLCCRAFSSPQVFCAVDFFWYFVREKRLMMATTLFSPLRPFFSRCLFLSATLRREERERRHHYAFAVTESTVIDNFQPCARLIFPLRERKEKLLCNETTFITSRAGKSNLYVIYRYAKSSFLHTENWKGESFE